MNYAIILSGGTGVRLGGTIPKQYIEIDGRPIISDCIDVFESCAAIDKYDIVASNEWEDYISKYTGNKFIGFANPGKNRQLSIYNGLLTLKDYAQEDDLIIVHDAARPFVSEKILSLLVGACDGYDGAMPALPVKDTMYIKKNGRVEKLIDRDSIIAGQAPEAFAYGKYLRANEELLPDSILNIKGSTEPAFLSGMNIAVIDGDENNFKITTKEDLDRYIQIKNKGLLHEGVCIR